MGSRVAGVDGRQVGRRAYVGDDDPEVRGRDDPADDVLDLGDRLLGELDPRARRGLQVDDELARVGPREVGQPDRGRKAEAQDEEPQDADDGRDGPAYRHRLRAVEPLEKPVEPRVEPPVEPAPDRARGNFAARVGGVVRDLARPNELGAEQRDDRHRDEVRGEERKDDGKRECREQELAHSREEGDREEHDRGRQRGGEDRERHLLAPLFRGDLRRLAELHVPENVLEHDHRVVDQAREDEGEAAEDHRVHRAAAELERNERGQHRQGDGEENGEGRAHAAEEHQDHQARQHHPDQALVDEVLDRGLHEHGLVKDDRRHERLVSSQGCRRISGRRSARCSSGWRRRPSPGRCPRRGPASPGPSSAAAG